MNRAVIGIHAEGVVLVNGDRCSRESAGDGQKKKVREELHRRQYTVVNRCVVEVAEDTIHTAHTEASWRKAVSTESSRLPASREA